MTEQSAPAVTVIIPTWNGRDLLRHCLASLCDQDLVPRILVVDNGSNDGTAEMIESEFSDVDYLGLPENMGFARAVNEGIRHSRSPFIALLNNDTEADPGWIREGLAAFDAHPDAGFLASRMIDFHDHSRLDSAGDCYSRTGLPYKRGLGDHPERYIVPEWVLGASAGAAFYRRSTLDGVGLLDEDFFMYLEDVEWSLRANLSGHRCLYVPDAVVYHIEAASDPELAAKRRDSVGVQTLYSDRRVFWITRNRWQLMMLYQAWADAPWLLYGWVKSYCFHLLKAGHSKAFLEGLAAGIRQTQRCLTKRKHLRKQAKLSKGEWRTRMHECSRSV